MKAILFFISIFLGCFTQAWSQYQTSESRTWDKYPPEAQERGFGVNKSQLLQMDADPALEEVFLFSADNGHYPYFDLFKVYYVIVDYYTKEIEYKSEILISSKRELVLEDRNNDGVFELYRAYFQEGKFSVDASGNNLSVGWGYDRVEWNGKKITHK
jgi:chitinase